MRNIIKVFLLITLFSTGVFAQGVCVHKPLKINTLKGKVMTLKGKVMVHLNKGDEPLSDVSVRLFKRDKEKVFKETKTNSSGEFEIGKLKRGNYILFAEYPNLEQLAVHLLVFTSKTKTSGKEILIWLDVNFIEPCGGAYAEVKEQ